MDTEEKDYIEMLEKERDKNREAILKTITSLRLPIGPETAFVQLITALSQNSYDIGHYKGYQTAVREGNI
jgi:hypothetical protein